MWLFIAMILAHGICVSCIESPFDPMLLYQTTTVSYQDEVVSNVTVENIKDGDNTSADNNDKNNGVVTWECGVDFLTKFISESKIDRNCPRLKRLINQCCIEHDNCYNEQRGRTYCDDIFCACLDVATKSNQVCHKRYGKSFCALVRNFGEYAYNNAG
ncbi:hypothetical protein LOAG_13970 [Loa loa]|nr:hypothetical protein LOAG_13970 [Loa loa]EFO14547.2 hypothetical protein LOAG_13970 [Loa loa]